MWETHLELKFYHISFAHITIHFSSPFAFGSWIVKLGNTLWANKISWDLSERWVPGRFPLLQQPHWCLMSPPSTADPLFYSLSENLSNQGHLNSMPEPCTFLAWPVALSLALALWHVHLSIWSIHHRLRQKHCLSPLDWQLINPALTIHNSKR